MGMGCQKEIATSVVARKADYILAVKGNEERLHEAVQGSFAHLVTDPEAIPHFATEAQREGHGRKECPRVTTLDALQHLPEDLLFRWPKLETLVRIQSETHRNGKLESEERFYITTLPMMEVEGIARSVRSHWGIENRLPWVLDGAFREDGIRTRMGNGPECAAILRHIVLNLLRQDPNPRKRSIKNRRLKAALVPDYRLVALLGFPAAGSTRFLDQPRPKTYTAIKDKKFPINPLLLG